MATMSAAYSAAPKGVSGLPTSAEFLVGAKAGEAVVMGTPLVLEVKEFSSGSYGWYANAKVLVTLPDGRRVQAQLGLNLTVVGSKPQGAK